MQVSRKIYGPIDSYDALNDGVKVTKLPTKEVANLKDLMGLEEDQRRKKEVPTIINSWIMEEEERRQRNGNDSGDHFAQI